MDNIIPDTVILKTTSIPSLKYDRAKQKNLKKIMITTHGGLGDQVCAEPTMRYAFKIYKDYDLYLGSSFPELFTHLLFKELFNKEELIKQDPEEYLVLHTNSAPNNIVSDFYSHYFTQPVEFCSLAGLQRQLPIKDRQIQLSASPVQFLDIDIAIHPGKNWPSKTFPKEWWDELIHKLAQTYKIAIVGKDVDNLIGTVDVSVPQGAYDLRNKLNLNELTSILQNVKICITNDSSPIHIAASGDAHILFVSTIKHPDYLMHWRNGQFGYKMKDFSRDGLWNHINESPIRNEELRIDVLPDGLMEKILPQPNEIIDYIKEIALKS